MDKVELKRASESERDRERQIDTTKFIFNNKSVKINPDGPSLNPITI